MTSDYTEIWQLKDVITTVVEANGYKIWNLGMQNGNFYLELTEHIEDEDASLLCGQFPITADYMGEGYSGTIFTLYIS